MKRRIELILFLSLTGHFLASNAAENPPDYELSLQDHRFTPSELVIPADAKVKVTIRNEDATPEEFESRSLKREKIIPGKSQAVISIGPLKPGTYEFSGEFHESTARGRIIVK
jgi:hypothetical protein